jgi:4-hydroxy-L-threonine phosphate dehydrogenase PdxA
MVRLQPTEQTMKAREKARPRRKPKLQLVQGSKDAKTIIELLEEALAKARAGQVDAVIVGLIENEGHDIQTAYTDDVAFLDARLHFMLADLQLFCVNEAVHPEG